MIYTVKTDKSLGLIKTQMEQNAKDAGFGLLSVYEFKKILHDKSPNFKVFAHTMHIFSLY